MRDAAGPMDELVEDLCSKDPATRTSARRYLIVRGPEAIPSLVSLLRAPEQHVRWEAAKTLEGIAHPSAVVAMVEALADPDGDVCWVAAGALVAIGESALKPLFVRLTCEPSPAQPAPDQLYQGAHHVLHRLAQQTGSCKYDELLNALSHEDPELAVPQAAAKLL